MAPYAAHVYMLCIVRNLVIGATHGCIKNVRGNDFTCNVLQYSSYLTDADIVLSIMISIIGPLNAWGLSQDSDGLVVSCTENLHWNKKLCFNCIRENWKPRWKGRGKVSTHSANKRSIIITFPSGFRELFLKMWAIAEIRHGWGLGSESRGMAESCGEIFSPDEESPSLALLRHIHT